MRIVSGRQRHQLCALLPKKYFDAEGVLIVGPMRGWSGYSPQAARAMRRAAAKVIALAALDVVLA